MGKQLLDVIFASDKRKSILLLLRDGAKEMDILLRSLETPRQSLLPQIKILKDHYLVIHYDDTYELTTIGKIIVDEMIPLLGIIDVFDNDIEYWGTHNLGFIPPHLLKRINSLGKCNTVTPLITESHEISKEFQESSKQSTSIFTATRFLHPNFPSLLSDLLKKHLEVQFIISKDLLDKLRTHHYVEFKELFENNAFHLYVYQKNMDFMSFAYNDHHLMIVMMEDNGEYDNKYILCDKQSALQWGKEIFEFYLKDSVLITAI